LFFILFHLVIFSQKHDPILQRLFKEECDQNDQKAIKLSIAYKRILKVKMYSDFKSLAALKTCCFGIFFNLSER